jgi:hypothetical protein
MQPHPFERMRAERAAMMPRMLDLQARWPEAVGLWIAGNEGVLYQTYPYMLRGAYPSVDDERVKALSMGLWMLFESVFLSDKVVDGDAAEGRWSGETMLRVQAMQMEAYAQLHRLFPPDSLFWARLRDAWAAYARTCLLERRLAEDPTRVDRHNAVEVAAGKFPFSHLAVHGLAALSGDGAKTERLVRSLAHFDLVTCYWDDIRDWRKDLAARAPSIARGFVLSAHPELRDAGADDEDAYGRALFGGGHAEEMIVTAIRHLRDGQAGVDGLGADDWVRMLAPLAAMLERKLAIVREHAGTRHAVA